MTHLYNYCFVSERTDVGCKRKANEDNLIHFECQNGLVATVCDGMGGHVGGAVASQVAIDTIQQVLTENYFESPHEAIGMAIDAANKAILNRARLQPELQGMGSTCVLLIVRDGKVYIGSVGDSRIYLIRNRIITQLTKDQSFVQMLVDRGDITKEEAEHHPRKNEITNCLGIQEMRPATVLPEAFTPEAGDCFLLCSDGLSGMVSDENIERIVSRQAELTSQQRVDTLVEMAKRNGGVDNISVQIVEFAVNPQTVSKKEIPWKWIISGIIALGVIAAGSILVKNIFAKDTQSSIAPIITKTDVIFSSVPFDQQTCVYIVNGEEVDTIVLCYLPDNIEQKQTIKKQKDLFAQLQKQVKNELNLEYKANKYIISSFEQCVADTFSFVLGNDSLQYNIRIIKKTKEEIPILPAVNMDNTSSPKRDEHRSASKKTTSSVSEGINSLDAIKKSSTGTTMVASTVRSNNQQQDESEGNTDVPENQSDSTKQIVTEPGTESHDTVIASEEQPAVVEEQPAASEEEPAQNTSKRNGRNRKTHK